MGKKFTIVIIAMILFGIIVGRGVPLVLRLKANGSPGVHINLNIDKIKAKITDSILSII